MCDLQGHFDGESYLLTDPVVLSKKEEFGVTDGGQMMIENFFGHHVCGRHREGIPDLLKERTGHGQATLLGV